MTDLIAECVESRLCSGLARRWSLAARYVGRCDGCARSAPTARLDVATEPAPRDGRYCPVCRLLIEPMSAHDPIDRYELREVRR